MAHPQICFPPACGSPRLAPEFTRAIRDPKTERSSQLAVITQTRDEQTRMLSALSEQCLHMSAVRIDASVLQAIDAIFETPPCTQQSDTQPGLRC